MPKPLLPISSAQLTSFISAHVGNPDMLTYVQAAKTLRNWLKTGKAYKCPCGDGAGTGTQTIKGVKHLCEGCEGDGWTAELMKSIPTAQGNTIVYKVVKA